MILMYVLIVIFHVSSICAMEPSPESSQISRGSELQKRRAQELSYEASSPSPSYIIRKNSDELNKNPKFKEALNRTELNPDQIKRLNERWENKYKKLRREHTAQLQHWTSFSQLFKKIILGGLGIHSGYLIGAFSQSSEREWLGASLGITAVGVLGYCYSIYTWRSFADCPPTRAHAIDLISKKDLQSLNQ